MIIDTHTHFYDPNRPQGVPWPPADNKLLYRTVLPDDYKALAEPEGVTGTVVVEASAWLEDNQWILDLAAGEPFIVGFVGRIAPNQANFQSNLDRFAANPLFRGIRCGGNYFEDITKGSFLNDMTLLAERDLSLDVLIREPQFAGLVSLAQAVPTLRIIIDHIAHMPVNGQAIPTAWVEDYRRLAANPNVYLKLSALMEQSTVEPAPSDLDFYRSALDLIWNSFGQDRLIYGSNWPVSARSGDQVKEGLQLVKAYFAEKGQTVSDKYFWQNTKAVYKWLER